MKSKLLFLASLLSFLSFLGILVFAPKVKADIINCTASLSPISPTSTQSTTVTINCPVEISGAVSLVVFSSAGIEIHSEGQTLTSGATQITFTLPPFAQGSYFISVSRGPDVLVSAQALEVTEGDTSDPAYSCGSKLPAEIGADPCPAQCPMTTQPGTFINYCGCGQPNQICCPAGNSMGLSACADMGEEDPLLCGPAGVCQYKAAKFYCDDLVSIDTAIGCIPVTVIYDFVVFALRWTIGISGGVAILIIIWGGLLILTSSGDPDKLNEGKALITSAIAGVVMVIFSVLLLRFVGVNILGLLQ